ncbi:hypothetical protein AKJ65_04980 [candidate division MSBL1 archaeon SCGC-AAA259E19]|uniref:Prepilin type IV endopeptidase peptidase domain-containing protein n=2 Tax=candidate division MSBL1 TaxID=215777 RepID=A0A133V4S6_9EURY|nr:hypothetical protein AKJ65_04980 [candidate division MSBL1 archaeon SCGC-AAA259E19]KXB01450.1 hypothetical protein AKJ41_01525 [candidate division MSBL1 archaeon SCGC-AAA259O05]
MFHDLVALLALGTVFVANYTDLRDRIIPNRLTFSMIAVGIALYLGFGIYEQDLFFAIQGGLWAGIAFTLAYGFWYVGGWAGGDVKLYTALGALLAGYEASSLEILPWGYGISYMEAPYPPPFTVLFNGVICLAPVLIAYVLIKSVRTPGIGGEIVQPVRESVPEILVVPFVIVGGSALGWELTALLGFGQLASFALAILIILPIFRLPLKFEAPLAVGLTCLGIYLYSLSALKFLGMTFVVALAIRLVFSSIKVIDRRILQEKISIGELEEGMIPAETIYEEDGKVRRYESPGLKERAKQIFMNPSSLRLSQDWDRVLADSRLAAGVSEEQVQALKGYVEDDELEDHIRIKKGLPFAPSFALGATVAIFYGDIYWGLISLLAGGF